MPGHDVRALLAAQRDAERRRREDVEVARQLRRRSATCSTGTIRARSGCSCCRRTTGARWSSATKELERRGEGGRAHRRADAPRRATPSSPTPGIDDVDRFRAAMDDDFDTPAALAFVFELVRDANTSLDEGRLDDAAAHRRHRARVVARCSGSELDDAEPAELDAEIAALVAERDAARDARTWPEPTASATSCSRGASCSRTRRNGTVWRRRDGPMSRASSASVRAASRSKGRRGGARAVAGRAPAGAHACTSSSSSDDDRRRRDRRSSPGRSCTSSAPRRSRRWRVPTCHQGVVAMAAPLRPADLDDLLARRRRVPRRARRCHRSAQPRRDPAFGGDRGRDRRHPAAASLARSVTPVVTKAAAGAIEYLPIARRRRHPEHARTRLAAPGAGRSGSTSAATVRCSTSSSPTSASCSCSAPKAAVWRASRASAATCSCASRCTVTSRR